VSDVASTAYPINYVDGEIEIVECFVPVAPTGVDAWNGLAPNLVRVTWNASNGATYYRIYRANTNNLNDAEFIGETDSVYFDDYNLDVATGGCARMNGVQTSYFWVEAWSPCGHSDLSVPDAGFLSGSKVIQIGDDIEPAPASVIPTESLGEFFLFALLLVALVTPRFRSLQR
jgi:hypothetical protein